MLQAIYSIGHSRHSLAAFLGLLGQHRIEALVDVRSQPFSRFSPQFNRRALERTLPESGIAYVFRGDALGGRPSDPGMYDPDGHAVYSRMAVTPDFTDAIDRLTAAAEGDDRIAVMCSEEDPTGCHRLLLIGRVIASRGIEVLHIRSDGRLMAQGELDASITQPSFFQTDRTWRSVKPVRRR